MDSNRGILVFYTTLLLSASPIGDAIDYSELLSLPSLKPRTISIDLDIPNHISPLIKRAEILSLRIQRAYGLDPLTSDNFSWWIVDAADYFHLPENILAALIMTESTFRTDAVSYVGAIGPAQIRPEIWSEFCLYDIQKPEHNIFCGARILSHYLNRYNGDWSKAISAYNVGPSRVYQRRYAKARHRYKTKIKSYEQALIDMDNSGHD